jgi:hypothetical protein
MDHEQTSTTPKQSSEPAFAFANANPGTAAKAQPVRVFATLALVGCMGFAMLIWYKLRVVTNVPRTAYAEPEDNVGQPKDAANQRETKTAEAPTP